MAGREVFHLPPWLKQAFQEHARKRKRKKSAVAREALTDYLDRQRELPFNEPTAEPTGSASIPQ